MFVVDISDNGQIISAKVTRDSGYRSSSLDKDKSLLFFVINNVLLELDMDIK